MSKLKARLSTAVGEYCTSCAGVGEFVYRNPDGSIEDTGLCQTCKGSGENPLIQRVLAALDIETIVQEAYYEGWGDHLRCGATHLSRGREASDCWADSMAKESL